MRELLTELATPVQYTVRCLLRWHLECYLKIVGLTWAPKPNLGAITGFPVDSEVDASMP